MSKPMLHEILAVEQGLANTAKNILQTTATTFANKRSVFEGQIKTHQRFNEDEQNLVQAPEIVTVRNTVNQNLDFLHGELSEYWDAMVRKESANQFANADIVVGGKTIVEGVPATALLALEKKLAQLMQVYLHIPTLDVAKQWQPATDKGAGVFETTIPEERFQTNTKVKHIIVAPATDKHAAQVREVSETENVGKFSVVYNSGCMPSEAKADLLHRLGELQRAVKQARMRANQVEVEAERGTAESIFNFLMNK